MGLESDLGMITTVVLAVGLAVEPVGFKFRFRPSAPSYSVPRMRPYTPPKAAPLLDPKFKKKLDESEPEGPSRWERFLEEEKQALESRVQRQYHREMQKCRDRLDRNQVMGFKHAEATYEECKEAAEEKRNGL